VKLPLNISLACSAADTFRCIIISTATENTVKILHHTRVHHDTMCNHLLALLPTFEFNLSTSRELLQVSAFDSHP